MSATEFSLGLFGLLLGFILVEVLSGLMRTLRARLPNGPDSYVETHIGWLTPMLGIFTMLNVLLVWGTTFVLQDVLPVGYDTWTLGLLLCSFYYYAAGMIFPGDPRVWPDVDDWFWLHRRQVIGCIFTANIPFWLSEYFVWDHSPSELFVNTIIIASNAGMMLLAIFANRRWVVVGALATLIGTHLSFVPLEYLHRQGLW
jgi:hypothetical protein